MFAWKQNPQSNKRQLGFTLIELIVVIAIMVAMATLFIANYNGTRAERNLKIAQSQMVTNIRKTQSYILSARNVNPSSSIPAKYYVLKFDTNASNYLIQSVDTNYNLNSALETLSLPQGITISAIQSVTADNITTTPSTVQLAYASPYAKLYTYAATDCTSYNSLVTAVQDPGCLLTLADRKTTVTLRDAGSSATKTVIIYGVTGKVETGP